MESNMPRKIHIIGSVGSGKTTLARRLSIALNIPYYELDNVVWIRDKNGDIRRTPEERERNLYSIITNDVWILEGVHNEEWVYPSFQNADVILFVDTNFSVRNYRIVKRFFRQKLGIEKANYKPTIRMFFKFFKWNGHFEKNKSGILKRLTTYNHKLRILSNNNMEREVICYDLPKKNI